MEERTKTELASLGAGPIVISPDNDLVEAPHFDTLHGQHIKNGDRLFVTWPNGFSTAETVEVERRLPPYAYGGRIYQAFDDRAFITIEHRGAKVRLYLRWTPGIVASWIG